MTLTEQVAAIFRAKPNQWIDGTEFVSAGGYGGWSSRIRDLRKPPYGWTIDCRPVYHEFMGRKWKTAEYRWVTGAERHAEAS